MGRSPAWATVVAALALGAAFTEGKGQVTPACADGAEGDCEQSQEGQSILQIKSLGQSSAQLPDVVEEGLDNSPVKPQPASLKTQGPAGGGGRKKPFKGKVLLQTDTSALSRGGPVEEDMREDFGKVPTHMPVRVLTSAKKGEAISHAEEQEIVKSISQAEETGLQEIHQKTGKKGRRLVKATSLVQMANTKSRGQLQDEDTAQEDEEEEDQFAENLHITPEEENQIMMRVARAKASSVALPANDLTADKIREIVKSAAMLQDSLITSAAAHNKAVLLQQGNISGSEDASHGMSGQSMLDAIAAAEEEKLTEDELKATEEAASQERLLPPQPSASLLQNTPQDEGKEPIKPSARKGEMRKPARGKSLVQMTNKKYKAQLQEEDTEQDRTASTLGIGLEEERNIMVRIARAKERGLFEPSRDLSLASIKEIVKSAALFQQLTPSAAIERKQEPSESISGTEDAKHGHSAQDMLDAIAAEEEEKLSEAEQKASEEAASQERLLPPNQTATALTQKKSRPATARRILTEEPQKPSTSGKDFFEWVAEQEDVQSRPAANKGEMRKPAKGKSLVQMTNKRYKTQLHEDDKAQAEEASKLHISAAEEQDIAARIARATEQGSIRTSSDLTVERIKEIVKSAALFQQLTPSVSATQQERSRQEPGDGVSGTEDAAHGHRSQDMLEAIAAAEEEKLSEAEQKASEEAASQERLLPPNQTALLQEESRPTMAGKILTEEPQRPSTGGKDFFDWVAEQEEAERKPAAREGQFEKPAKRSSLVQMADTRSKTQFNEEEEEAHSEDDQGWFANSVHISTEEEQHILASIARATAKGVIHPSKDLTVAQIQEIVKSAALLHHSTPGISSAQEKQDVRQANPDISGTEDAAHGHRSQDMLEAIAAAEDEKLTEEEQKASEEAASQERLLPPNQTALMQEKSRPVMPRQILTEEPQRPIINGKDLYDWVAEQEEAEMQSAARMAESTTGTSK